MLISSATGWWLPTIHTNGMTALAIGVGDGGAGGIDGCDGGGPRRRRRRRHNHGGDGWRQTTWNAGHTLATGFRGARAPTLRKLREAYWGDAAGRKARLQVLGVQEMAVLRRGTHVSTLPPCPLIDRELWFMRREARKAQEKDDEQLARKLNTEEAEGAHALITCGCCCNDVSCAFRSRSPRGAACFSSCAVRALGAFVGCHGSV
ncbi:unnamed protein product [Phaeothamnion confervicola]